MRGSHRQIHSNCLEKFDLEQESFLFIGLKSVLKEILASEPDPPEQDTQDQPKIYMEEAMTSNAMPLSMANEGDRVKVIGLLGGTGLDRKVTEMGLNVGAEIEIRQREKGAVVVARGETRYAIGAGMAHKIMVTPIGSSK